MKRILLVTIILLVIGCKFIANEEKANYTRAVENCGGASNVVEKHTGTGDTYYTCKNN